MFCLISSNKFHLLHEGSNGQNARLLRKSSQQLGIQDFWKSVADGPNDGLTTGHHENEPGSQRAPEHHDDGSKQNI